MAPHSYMTIEKTFTDSVSISPKEGDGIYTGGTYGWRDITGQVNVKGVGVGDPDWVKIGTTAHFAYRFAVNDQCWFVYHIPHDIVPGADVHFHVHWIPDGTNGNAVKWEFTYAFAKGFDQAAFDLGLAESPLVDAGVVTAESTPSAVAYQHMVTETDAVTIPGITEPDGLIQMRIKRITNGGTENTDEIFMLTSDVHYQSTNMATANRSPWFYRG